MLARGRQVAQTNAGARVPRMHFGERPPRLTHLIHRDRALEDLAGSSGVSDVNKTVGECVRRHAGLAARAHSSEGGKAFLTKTNASVEVADLVRISGLIPTDVRLEQRRPLMRYREGLGSVLSRQREVTRIVRDAAEQIEAPGQTAAGTRPRKKLARLEQPTTVCLELAELVRPEGGADQCLT
jgi:hypothetical protein